jgi:hypothetical protein
MRLELNQALLLALERAYLSANKDNLLEMMLSAPEEGKIPAFGVA